MLMANLASKDEDGVEVAHQDGLDALLPPAACRCAGSAPSPGNIEYFITCQNTITCTVQGCFSRTADFIIVPDKKKAPIKRVFVRLRASPLHLMFLCLSVMEKALQKTSHFQNPLKYAVSMLEMIC